MKAGRLLSLSIAFALFAALSVAAGATPLAGPCAPGTAYDPACDVNHDNQITIADIQLTAGHWNQTGTFVGDNNHNHLGQTWTGANNPLKIEGSYGEPGWAPLVLSNSATDGDGLIIHSAGYDGVFVGSAGGAGVFVGSAGVWGVRVGSAVYGVHVYSAGKDGVYVYSVGYPSSYAYSTAKNGFEVAGAEGFGLYVGRADDDGVRIRSAGDDGIQIGEDGVLPNYALYVPSPGTTYDTLLPNTANAAGQWALFTVDNILAGNVFMNAQTLVAVVGGDQPLGPGDVVAAIGLADPIPGSLNHLAQVRLAATDQANVVGVVSSRMALQPAPGKEGEQVMHSTDGPAQPGDYVAITVLGVAQVKVGDTASIEAGQRLTVADTPGYARALRTVEVEGVKVDESGPTIGVVLEPAKDGMVWVLVNPQ